MRPIIWDDAAQRALSSETTRAVRSLSLKEAREKEQEIIQQSRLVGSTIYTKMFRASNHTAIEKVVLLLEQLGAQIEEGTLQLTGPYKIDPELAPHDDFLNLLAKTIQQAYRGKLLDDPRVHQLRMYLDRQNIRYIRKKFGIPGPTDEDALAAYVHAPKKAGGLGGHGLRAERARLHNKYQTNYLAGNENRKRVTPDFHSEFILDPEGRFVSQWNVLEMDEAGKVITDFFYYKERYPTYAEWHYFQQQILNGESFNYADRNDNVHRRLDSLPPIHLDYPLRKKLGKEWNNPQDKLEYHWREVDRNPEPYAHRKNIGKKWGVFIIFFLLAKLLIRKHK
ncbi:DUF3114 domain-containing protein [Enterococcus sp. AZ163]|uniref:DUF3114 domain-containing protein n=1 Tax=Enterococcus sp. AZ163 TaxID=2774638 RepID=UPI003D2BFDF7